MFTFAQITDIVVHNAASLGDAALPVRQLLFDSRRLTTPDGTLFFAIKTRKSDGHKYIGELAGKGVRNFIITDEISGYGKKFPDCNFLQVQQSVYKSQLFRREYSGLPHR